MASEEEFFLIEKVSFLEMVQFLSELTHEIKVAMKILAILSSPDNKSMAVSCSLL
jgi:hypothetical protein